MRKVPRQRRTGNTGNRNAVTHGHSSNGKRTGTYVSWQQMISRCTDPRCPSWPRYGGRGIRVCRRWRKFENFLADMGERPSGTSIERIRSARGYAPGNCRWATSPEQSRNKSSNVWLSYNGVTLIVSDWADRRGIPRSTLKRRLADGWPPERALAPGRVR